MLRTKSYLSSLKTYLFLFISLTGYLTVSAQPMEKQEVLPVKKQEVKVHSSLQAEIIPSENEQKFVLKVENPDKSKICIKLLHPLAGEVYRKETSDEFFRQCFDFKQAEDGQYTVVITRGKERIRKKVDITTETEISRKIKL